MHFAYMLQPGTDFLSTPRQIANDAPPLGFSCSNVPSQSLDEGIEDSFNLFGNRVSYPRVLHYFSIRDGFCWHYRDIDLSFIK